MTYKNTKAKGDLAESQVLAALVKNGTTVLIPFGDNERYDFVIDRGAGFERVQVKFGRYENGCVVFSCASTGVKYTPLRNYIGHVECFMVYCLETNKVYEIPISKARKRQMCLRVEKPEQYTSRIEWAKDYELKLPS